MSFPPPQPPPPKKKKKTKDKNSCHLYCHCQSTNDVYFFISFLRVLSIFNTHTHRESEECLKKIDSNIYPKGPYQ